MLNKKIINNCYGLVDFRELKEIMCKCLHHNINTNHNA